MVLLISVRNICMGGRFVVVIQILGELEVGFRIFLNVKTLTYIACGNMGCMAGSIAVWLLLAPR